MLIDEAVWVAAEEVASCSHRGLVACVMPTFGPVDTPEGTD